MTDSKIKPNREEYESPFLGPMTGKLDAFDTMEDENEDNQNETPKKEVKKK